MEAILDRIEGAPELAAVAHAIGASRGEVHLDGLASPAKAPVLAALRSKLDCQVLLLTPTEEQADKLHLDLSAILPPGQVRVFPSIEMTLYEMIGVDHEVVADRLATLGDLLDGRPIIVVASINSLLHDIVPPEVLTRCGMRLSVGQEVVFEALPRLLLEAGYTRVDLTTDPGQFSVRGGIIDFYPPTSEHPVRMEFFGDEVDSIRLFDPGTQRSSQRLTEIAFGPATELPLTPDRAQRVADMLQAQLEASIPDVDDEESARRLRRTVREHAEALSQEREVHGLQYYLPYLYDRPATLLDYLAPNSVIIADEPLRMQSHAEELLEELAALHETRVRRGELLRLGQPVFRTFEEARELIRRHRVVYLTLLSPSIPWARLGAKVSMETASMESYRGQFELLANAINDWCDSGQAVVLATSQRKRLIEILKLHGVGDVELYRADEPLEPRAVRVGTMPIQAGFRLPTAGLYVLTDREIFGYQRAVVPHRRGRDEVQLTSLADLHIGDLVVHTNHGIGRYVGIVKKTIDGVERDYLEIHYAGEDRLFVPTPQIDRIQKYIGAEGCVANLHSLSDVRWSRTRKKAQEATEILARELLRLYAARERAEGFAFSPDQPWQVEVEDAFIYEDTPDQTRALADVKEDMERPKPMDRLLCGDVGFGKTEVAIRAALKAVLDGKQVAVIVPTTVLAQQHLGTFQERLGAYPIRIDLLSRFRSREQQRRTLESLQVGEVDIVIGTHRLLSKDVKIKDLGLLIIDEEQRFGVKHKETLKQLRNTVDVLTMTATPIPRTLHMSLAGLRNMSLMTRAPQGRVPIRTFCVEDRDEMIRDAIERELEREGQVYFVHNRVQSIQHLAQRVKKLVPRARIAVGHGQMNEESLERVMLDFYAGEYDVLVCTSIIESGLDVPNVNTLIVHDSHRFGLAQLYQLRGRVGRSSRQAHAYFLYRHQEALTPQAEERLAAIREFTELGSGYKVAMRDLEIRGAGNLLGPEQHGHIEAIGFELYCQMLQEAVRELRGEPTRVPDMPAIELPLDAFIPSEYVPEEGLRLDLYRRISLVRDTEALERVRVEMEDRFGPAPPQAENLVRVLGFRIACAERGITQVVTESAAIVLRAAEGRRITPRSKRMLHRYALDNRRRSVRDMGIDGRRVSIRFMNIPVEDRLRVLNELVLLTSTMDESEIPFGAAARRA